MTIRKVDIEELYDSLLRDMENSGVSGGRLMEETRNRYIAERVMSGGKAIPTFLKPVFIPEERIRQIKNITNITMDCLEKVSNLFFESERHEHLFELGEGEKELAKIDPGYPRRIQHARLDAFINGDSIQFCEFNCDTPGGPGYSDIQTDLLLETEAMKKLGKSFTLKPDRFMPGILDSLTSCYEHFKGGPVSTLPPFGIISVFDMDPTTEELSLMAKWFAAQGCEPILAEPEECTYENGVFRVKGIPVDLVYRRGTTQWWISESEKYQAMWSAYRDGKLCLVNPLNSKLAGKKSLMAVLQSEEMAPRLTEAERAIIKEHIPWTRIVKSGVADYQGKKVDMEGFILENRENLVLKPIGLYGGKGVVVGGEEDNDQWRTALETAKKTTHVVQEYINIPELSFPVYDPHLKFVKKKVNINFFAFNGKYSGGMARVSDSAVINVSAGGGLIPIMPYTSR